MDIFEYNHIPINLTRNVKPFLRVGVEINWTSVFTTPERLVHHTGAYSNSALKPLPRALREPSNPSNITGFRRGPKMGSMIPRDTIVSLTAVHWENYVSISFHSEWDMIAVTVCEPKGNSIWFKNRHRDHIPFTVEGNGNIVFSVYTLSLVALFSPIYLALNGTNYRHN